MRSRCILCSSSCGQLLHILCKPVFISWTSVFSVQSRYLINIGYLHFSYSSLNCDSDRGFVFSFQEHFASLHAEFKNEIALLKKIEHRNLVQLLGYIDKGNERIVITEFVSNGTLRDHLDGMLQTIMLLCSIPSLNE
jgi:hypothetical protein